MYEVCVGFVACFEKYQTPLFFLFFFFYLFVKEYKKKIGNWVCHLGAFTQERKIIGREAKKCNQGDTVPALFEPSAITQGQT